MALGSYDVQKQLKLFAFAPSSHRGASTHYPITLKHGASQNNSTHISNKQIHSLAGLLLTGLAGGWLAGRWPHLRQTIRDGWCVCVCVCVCLCGCQDFWDSNFGVMAGFPPARQQASQIASQPASQPASQQARRHSQPPAIPHSSNPASSVHMTLGMAESRCVPLGPATLAHQARMRYVILSPI